jgi:hypothetical protein
MQFLWQPYFFGPSKKAFSESTLFVDVNFRTYKPPFMTLENPQNYDKFD